MLRGGDIIPIAMSHVGERYVLGARAPVLNANWRGPWDCAEFATWCAFRAYNILFGAEPNDTRLGDAFSGYWFEQSKSRGLQIDVSVALATPGAFLLRKPRREMIGHIAISLGNGALVEAADRRNGVISRPNSPTRRWDAGCLLPGVEYGAVAGPVVPIVQLTDIIRVLDPYMRGAHIVAIQRGVAAKGFDPGPIDGIYGEVTEAAIIAFQIDEGVLVDGEIGPQTAGALGLAWPIVPTPEDIAAFQAAEQGLTGPGIGGALGIGGPAPIQDTGAAQQAALRVVVEREGERIFARAAGGGERVLVGRELPFEDMRGLGQSGRRGDLPLVRLAAGAYDPAQAVAEHGLWAWFVWPTAMAESDGLYARLNSYDKAGMTFGMYQCAAHTPRDNLVLLLRALLRLPDASVFFPHLALVDDRIHERRDGATVDLEAADDERGTKLSRMLNPSLVAVEPAEIDAAARFILWANANPKARAAQVAVAVAIARRKLVRAHERLDLGRRPLSQCIWISDVLHHGRGGRLTFQKLRDALDAADPIDALSSIGAPRWEDRIAKVARHVGELDALGVITGKTFDDLVLVA